MPSDFFSTLFVMKELVPRKIKALRYVIWNINQPWTWMNYGKRGRSHWYTAADPIPRCCVLAALLPIWRELKGGSLLPFCHSHHHFFLFYFSSHTQVWSYPFLSFSFLYSKHITVFTFSCLMTPVTSRNSLIERCSTYRGCEPCKRRKRVCNGKRPCGNCNEAQLDCVYSVVSDHARSVFTTTNARRLSSGSACETCRRRKTKCDGGNPCAFCASAGIECINNSERRKRSLSHNNINLTTNMATLSASSTSSSGATSGSDHGTDAIDRIEDRLRRIEKLMTAFTPSPLSQSTSFHTDGSTTNSDNTRKLSSPQPPLPSSLGIRQHRHSVQGISVAKEQAALRSVMMAG